MDLMAVLLDVDGTLLDSNDAHARAWAQALQQNGHVVEIDVLRGLIGKGGDKLLEEAVGIELESAAGQRIDADRRALFSSVFLPKVLPTRGARALLEGLLARGVVLAVATSSGKDDLAALLRQAGVDDLLGAGATSDDAERSKPDPDIVQAALDKLGVPASHTFMLGDTPHDVHAASAAGVPTVALRCGGWWREDAFADAIAVFDDPADLLAHLDDLPFEWRKTEADAMASRAIDPPRHVTDPTPAPTRGRPEHADEAAYVDVSDPIEVSRCAQSFGVSEEEIHAAVSAVGLATRDIRVFLGRRRMPSRA